MKKNVVNSNTSRFLVGSFIGLVFVSIIVFLFVSFYVNRIGDDTISAVGDLYMTGMSDELSAHFETLISSKLEQAEAAVAVVSTDDEDLDAMYKELVYRVQVRGFEHLALCSEDGEFQILYGGDMKLADPDSFLGSLRKGDKKLAIGVDEKGNDLAIFGVEAAYPMENGEKSIAMIVALPVKYIIGKLGMEKEDSLVYSYIIRKDGSFVIRDSSVDLSSYFDYTYEQYDAVDNREIDDYIENLTKAMQKREDYSVIFQTGDSRQQVYCTALSHTEWYLITVLPYGILDDTINSLNNKKTMAFVIAFTIIAVLLLLIFWWYLRMMRRRLQEVEAAREVAIRATKAKSEFLSNMSHDIRTPMNAIVGMTAIATAHIDDKEQVRHCLRKIALSGKHLLGLINDVLDMSKIESGKMTLSMEQASLPEVVEGIVGIVQSQIHAKKQNFNVLVDNIEVENVFCDSVRLNQVLLNLLSNAVKYTPEGGDILFTLYEEESPKGDNYIRAHVKVEDNGIGMSEEFQKKIFESYTRADNKRVHKTEGAGLGMAITKYIVDAMEGELEVDSELGKGTSFHLILDFEKALVKEVDMILPPWKMLVVDDDEMMCRTTAEALDSIGIMAEWTLSGEDAVQLVRKHHQKRDDYQIILLDWKLPGMNGIQTAKEIRQEMGDNVPILLISAYDWSEFEAEAREAGVSGFISKPLFKSTLYYGLQKYMGSEDSQIETTGPDADLIGRRVLVAEDNDLNWEVLKELLSDLGLELEWAENGQICVDKFKQSKEGFYEAIFMDVRMPVMTGYEATEAIRAMERPDAQTIPIIAMTADAFSEDVQHCLDCGMNAHTAKPINMTEIVFLLKKYLIN